MCLNKITAVKKAGFFFFMLFALHKNYAQQPAVVAGAVKVEKVYVTGIVKDAATGKAIVGARLSVTNFSAAISDESGAFKLTVANYYDNVIVVAEGYDTKQIALKGNKTLSISLLDAQHSSFQDIVTMPYKQLPLREITTAVTSYNANSEWRRPMETADALLQGRVAGLQTIRRSGAPGVGANLFLRGYNSLFATNKPLVIVNGMVYDINDYGQSIIANNYTNPFALINAQDIEDITVIKDAASMYGVKGANGVILITTSKAKQQATKIDFGAYTSYNIRPSAMQVMDADAYRVYLTEMLQSKGLSSSEISAMAFMKDDTTGNAEYYRYHNRTNWQDEVLKNSLSQNYFLKVTGGDNIATYALSMGYAHNKGIVSTSDWTRYNTHFNADFNFSRKFTGAANFSFAFNEQNLKDQGIADKTAPVFLALTKAPFLTANEVNSKGVFSPNYEDADFLGVSNPAAIINKMEAFNKYYRFFGSFRFNYAISKSFNASALFGVTYDKVRENIFVPRKGVANIDLSNAVADSRLGSQVKRLFTFYTDARVEYKKTFNRYHNFVSRLGVRFQQNDAEQDYALGFNSATDDLISVQNGINALRQVGGGIGEWNWMNNYFNAEYGYKDKLFVSLNAAMDASSRFGKDAKGVAIDGIKFAVLPSASLAWLVSSESFMAHSKIDLLKLRLSYSLTGNDDIGNYSSRQTYTSQNFLGMQGLVRNSIPNPALQWETSSKYNAGVDIAFLNERVGLTVDFYQAKTKNMLVYETITAASGFSNILTNNGSMKNTGLEAALNVRVINKGKFRWDIGINGAFNKNEVIAVPGGSFTTEYAGATILTQNGQPANQFYGYEALGVFSTAAEASAAGLSKKNADGSYSSFTAGDIRFADLNNDKIIDEKDMKVIGSPIPDFYGGISNKVAYKNFQLEAMLTYAKGNEIYNYLRYRLEASSGVENQLNSVVNRWRAEGHVTSMPKASYGDPMGNSRFSNRWIEDGSYLRLRHVSLSYAVPVKEGFIKNATVYVTGNNLLTFTKYMGYDPEFSVTPGVFTQGIDTGLDPLYKTVTLGVKVGF